MPSWRPAGLLQFRELLKFVEARHQARMSKVVMKLTGLLAAWVALLLLSLIQDFESARVHLNHQGNCTQSYCLCLKLSSLAAFQ
mmetsp:Transcript_28867/g.66282  ORF Transcript_28867/g.66282 Transcript_28867/m.66282 type:complete len:84 (+) Transcript_28867:132-383(+)